MDMDPLEERIERHGEPPRPAESTTRESGAQGSGTARSSWSPMMVVGLTIVVLVVFLVVQWLTALGLATIDPASGEAAADAPAPQWNGWVLTISLLVSAPISVALTLSFARRGGGVVRDLALHPASASAWTVIRWLMLTLAFILVSDLVTQQLEHPVIPDFMLEAYRTARMLPLLWLAVVVAGPAFEEILFRGFLYDGIERSILGVPGAVIVPALGWTLLHMQYEIFHLTIVFGAGALLGLARWRTGSLYVPLAMHGVWNLIAMVQVALEVSG